jgi:hypothetical protein
MLEMRAKLRAWRQVRSSVIPTATCSMSKTRVEVERLLCPDGSGLREAEDDGDACGVGGVEVGECLRAAARPVI